MALKEMQRRLKENEFSPEMYDYDKGFPTLMSHARSVRENPEESKDFIWETADFLDHSQQELEKMLDQQNHRKSITSKEDQKARNKNTQIISEAGNIIRELIDNTGLKSDSSLSEISDFASEIKGRSDHVRRENPALATKAPYDVVSPEDSRKIVVVTNELTREPRGEYGMHFNLRNSSDLCVGMAFMPPGHKQPFHLHAGTPEYTMNLDDTIRAIFRNGDGENVIMQPSTYEIAHFASDTVHTLYNPNQTQSRNITVKTPVCFSNYKRDSDSTSGHGEVITLDENESTKWGHKRYVDISAGEMDYRIEVLHIDPGKSMRMKNPNYDDFFYVVRGGIEVEPDQNYLPKDAEENSLVVLYQGTSAYINNNGREPSVLYRVVRND